MYCYYPTQKIEPYVCSLLFHPHCFTLMEYKIFMFALYCCYQIFFTLMDIKSYFLSYECKIFISDIGLWLPLYTSCIPLGFWPLLNDIALLPIKKKSLFQINKKTCAYGEQFLFLCPLPSLTPKTKRVKVSQTCGPQLPI